MIKAFKFLAIAVILLSAVLVPCLLSQPSELQAQIGEASQSTLATVTFEYPTIKVFRNSDFLRVATGSVSYYFYDNGADQIYNSDGSYIGTKKWRLFADTLSLDLVGKVTYVMIDNYRVLVTRTIPLSKLNGSVVITYDITGERTKTSVTVNTGALLLTTVKSLKLAWINNISKSSIVEESLSDGSVRYDFNNGRYFNLDWYDVQNSLGDIGTLNISSLSTTKEAEIVFELGALGKSSTITLDPTDSYTSAGTFYWECPATMSVDAEVWGGGGGGAFSLSGFAGGGGGGGAYSKKNNITVVPGNSYTVVVGAAGTGGNKDSYIEATTGGLSRFTGESAVKAEAVGGTRALYSSSAPLGGAGGSAASGTGDTKYSGGAGSNSVGSYPNRDGGGGGGSAGTGSNGNTATTSTGASAVAGGGNGGNGGTATNETGYAPTTPPGGGGGGGCAGISHGGAGRAGQVKLTYELIDPPTTVTDGSTGITSTGVTLKGNVTDNGGQDALFYKFEWGTTTGVYTSNYTSDESSYPVGNYTYIIASGLSAGTEYFWRFDAENMAGWGNSSESKFLTLPTKPTGLTITARTDGSISLSWSKGTAAEPTNTIIRYDTVGYPATYASGSAGYDGNDTTCTISTLAPATNYYIAAWSYVTIDGMTAYSPDSAQVSGYTRPSAPSSLTASNPSSNSLDLDWIQGTGGDKTKIRISSTTYPTTPDQGNPVYFDTGISTTALGLDPNILYYFSAFAYDSDSGLYSLDYDTASGTTEVAAPTITSGTGATNVTEITATLNGEVTITGGENPNCTFYWGDNDGGTDPGSWDNTKYMGAQGNSFSWDISGLIAGKTYYYIVHGENTGGNDWSSPSFEFVTGCIVPENLSASLITDYRIDVSWTKTMPVTIVRAGLDNPPSDMFDGISVYRGNGTSVSIFGAFAYMTGNLTLRAWADCTTCLSCSTFKCSDTYAETSLILTGNGTGGGGGGDMYKVVYDTNDDGVVDAADYATNAGDADTLDGLHAGEISGTGYGNITFVTDGGNATTLEGIINILGMGTISTFGGNNTIQISGTTFLSLPDTPDSYAGQGGLYVVVNEGENALEFVTGNITGSGTGNITFVTMSGNATSIDGVITMDGIDIETSGTEGTISLAIGGENVDTLATNSTLLIVFGIPFLLGVIGVWRNSITGYLAGIIGLSLSLGFMYDNIGMALAVVVLLVILGLIGSAIRNAWGEGLRVF